MKSVIDYAFELARLKKRKALIPYIMAGYPDLATTERLVYALWESEADIIELGIPFSDPIADLPNKHFIGYKAGETAFYPFL